MKLFVIFVLVLFAPFASAQQIDFSDYFEDSTMRVDYFHTACAGYDQINIDQILVDGIWAGNPKKLLSPTENGKYAIQVFDVASNKLIYSKHFLDIVFEYKGFEQGKQSIKKTYHQSAFIPCPKQPVLFSIQRRDKQNILHPVFSKVIDPNDAAVKKESACRQDKSFEIVKNGNPHNHVDLVFAAEGYAADEFDKFKKDAERFTEYLFSVKPFDSLKNKFNVSGVFHESAQSGVDIPRKSIYKNTAMDVSYDTFGSRVYATVFDNKSLRDIAAGVPHDHVIVLVNTEMYGGSGFYNSYTLFTSDNKRSAEIFTHELGHGFAGLADEYIAERNFDVYYTRGVEPLEPNITAWLNKKNVKWSHLMTAGAELPTPATKENINTVGLFEGAGYTKTGMYRSCRHCVMGAGGLAFCKACQEAIEDMIEFYSGSEPGNKSKPENKECQIRDVLQF